MITIKIGGIEAVLNGTTWTCEHVGVLRTLNVYTAAAVKQIGGGVPDHEEFIVNELANQLPLVVITPPAPAEGGSDEVVY